MNSNHHITCLQSVITHQRKRYSYVDLCSCCCAATVIACFWSVCAASPEVLCYRYNGLIHNTQLVWARSLTSTLCSQFFELGLTSKRFLQEFLKSFKALFPPLSPLFLSLVITGECCIWFAFIPENKRIFFPGAKCNYGCVYAGESWGVKVSLSYWAKKVSTMPRDEQLMRVTNASFPTCVHCMHWEGFQN